MQKYLLCSGGEAAIGGCQYAFSLGGGYWRLPIRRQRLRYWQEPIRVADAPISAKYAVHILLSLAFNAASGETTDEVFL